MTTDFHAHWVPPPLVHALRGRRGLPRIENDSGGDRFMMPVGALPFDETYSDLNARLRFMDRHGIAMQVLSLPCLFGLDTCCAAEALPLVALFNDATAEAARAHPDRIAGLAALPLADMEAAAAEYRRARRDLGLAGAIVPINYFRSRADVDRLTPLLEAAADLGGHLFLHPGRRADEAAQIDAAGTGRYPDSVMPRRQLEIQHEVAEAMVTLLWSDVTARYPGLTWHVANMGGTLPVVIERMDQTARLRGHEPVLPSERVRQSPVVVDCSSMGPVAIAAAVACFGAGRVLFGTDCPIYRSDWVLQALAQARITDADRTKIQSHNAQRLLAD